MDGFEYSGQRVAGRARRGAGMGGGDRGMRKRGGGGGVGSVKKSGNDRVSGPRRECRGRADGTPSGRRVLCRQTGSMSPSLNPRGKKPFRVPCRLFLTQNEFWGLSRIGRSGGKGNWVPLQTQKGGSPIPAHLTTEGGGTFQRTKLGRKILLA